MEVLDFGKVLRTAVQNPLLLDPQTFSLWFELGLSQVQDEFKSIY